MRSLTLSLEQFAAQRRSAQDRLVERLSGVVGAFLSTGDITALRAALGNVFTEEYAAETDQPLRVGRLNAFLDSVEESLEKASADSNVRSTTLALSLAVLNASAVAAAEVDPDGIVMEWITMSDGAVREEHERVAGQQRPPGEAFDVAGHSMPYPGWMGVPIELWINCRCSLRPAQAEALTAAADKEAGDWLAVMAVPAETDPVHGIGGEDKHATVLYLGEVGDDDHVEHVREWVAQIAADGQPFTAKVSGIEALGDEGAQVWLLEESDLNGMHEGVLANETIRSWYEAADITHYPTFTPHVTIGYDEQPDEASEVTEITFDRLAVWHGGTHYDYPLGAEMTDTIPEADETTEAPTEDEFETPVDAEAPAEPVDDRIPWHGVLAPEGIPSGDKRKFTNLGRTRDLPLPLTWQEVSAEGHDQSITVAMIEKVAMIDGLMHGSGHFLSSVEEADEVVGLISEFGRFGVSVDADDVGEYAFDEDEDMDVFDDPRVCSAAIVPIPAFAEAFVTLGPHPILDADPANGDPPEISAEPGVDVEEEIEEQEDEEALTAALPLLRMDGIPETFRAAVEARHAATEEDWSDVEAALGQQFADLAPGKTEDGPGWLTHPVDTDRLRDYWVRGPGAAKIAWGTPGDFNRCRANVAEYIKPQHLNGYCANRHYDALGFWPGRGAHAADTLELSHTAPAPAISLVAAGGVGWSAPSEFFVEPTDEECPDGEAVYVTDDGRTFGYIAEWGVCHVGIDGICTEAPPSPSNYAYFRKGHVNTPDGPVKVGALTVGTGHADHGLAAMPAAAHYDNTGAVWAYVTTGENARGIWFSGMVKPNVDKALLNDVVASGRLSGDWRGVGGELELMAALTVNVPGFPIQPVTASIHNGQQVSLVAAGVTKKAENAGTIEQDGNKVDVALIASMVVDEIEARGSRKSRWTALRERVEN